MLFEAINRFNQIVKDMLLESIVEINSNNKFGDRVLYQKAFDSVIRHPSYLKQLHISSFEETTGIDHSICVEIWDFLKIKFWDKKDDGVWRFTINGFLCRNGAYHDNFDIKVNLGIGLGIE